MIELQTLRLMNVIDLHLHGENKMTVLCVSMCGRHLATTAGVRS